MKHKQSGFALLAVPLIILVIGLAGFTIWRVTSSKSSGSDAKTASSQAFIWQQAATGWQASQTPPACAGQPMLKLPADISTATSVLYPGQIRGGNYKPHGGLRYNNSSDNKIEVTAPIDGYLIKGTRFLVEGEIQYGLDVMNNCGVMYRVGHVRELPANLQKIADTWPTPTTNSAFQLVSPAVFIKQGEVLATKVGLIASKNTFFDWGVYDYRQQNEASKAANYQAAHAQDKELSWHAVCWLQGWLPRSDEAALAKLPAGDPTSGKNSDYCK